MSGNGGAGEESGEIASPASSSPSNGNPTPEDFVSKRYISEDGQKVSEDSLKISNSNQDGESEDTEANLDNFTQTKKMMSTLNESEKQQLCEELGLAVNHSDYSDLSPTTFSKFRNRSVSKLKNLQEKVRLLQKSFRTVTILQNPQRQLVGTEETIADLAELLRICETPKELEEGVLSVDAFTPELLNLAAKHLSTEKHQQIREWVVSWNQRKQSQGLTETQQMLPEQRGFGGVAAHLSTQEAPGLAELQALLLACQTPNDQRRLKQNYTAQRVDEAYKALPEQQQLVVDSVSATIVPHQVFKYTGEQINRHRQTLLPNALCYVDLKTRVRQSGLVPVWLLHGVSQGWTTPISVSWDCLVRVEKATVPGSDQACEVVEPNLLE
jgi:hypothetical protein